MCPPVHIHVLRGTRGERIEVGKRITTVTDKSLICAGIIFSLVTHQTKKRCIMRQVNIHEATTHFSKSIKEVQNGDEIITEYG